MHYRVVKTLSGIHIINQHMGLTTIHSIAAGTSLFTRTMRIIDPGMRFEELDLHHRRAGRASAYHVSSATIDVLPHGDYEEALPRHPGLGVKVHSFTTIVRPAEWNFYCEDNRSGALLRQQGTPTELDTFAIINKLVHEFTRACKDHPSDETPMLPFPTKLDEVTVAVQGISELLKKRCALEHLGRREDKVFNLRDLHRNHTPIADSKTKSWDWVNQPSNPRASTGYAQYEPPLAPAEEMVSVELPKRFTRASTGIVPINLFKTLGDAFILGDDGGLYLAAGAGPLLDAIARQAPGWETFSKCVADTGNTPWFDLPRVLQALADNPEGVYSPYRIVDAERLAQYGRTAAEVIIDKAIELQAFDETMHPLLGDQVPAVPTDLAKWFREDVMVNYELIDLGHGTPMTLAKWDYIQGELGVSHRLTREAAMEVYAWLQHCTVGSKLIVKRTAVMGRYNVYTGIEEYRQLDVSLADWWHRAQPGLRDGIAPGDLLPSMVQRIIDTDGPDPMEQFLNVHTDDLFIRLKELQAIAGWSVGMIGNVAHLIETVHPDQRREVILAGIQQMHEDAKKLY